MAANSQPIEAPASQTQAPAAGFADLVAKVKPAVVSVRVRSDDPAQVSSNEESRNWQRFGRGFQNFFGFNDQFGNRSGDQFGDRVGTRRISPTCRTGCGGWQPKVPASSFRPMAMP
jgi:S1-C subfamily serine protease